MGEYNGILKTERGWLGSPVLFVHGGRDAPESRGDGGFCNMTWLHFLFLTSSSGTALLVDVYFSHRGPEEAAGHFLWNRHFGKIEELKALEWNITGVPEICSGLCMSSAPKLSAVCDRPQSRLYTL